MHTNTHRQVHTLPDTRRHSLPPSLLGAQERSCHATLPTSLQETQTLPLAPRPTAHGPVRSRHRRSFESKRQHRWRRHCRVVHPHSLLLAQTHAHAHTQAQTRTPICTTTQWSVSTRQNTVSPLRCMRCPPQQHRTRRVQSQLRLQELLRQALVHRLSPSRESRHVCLSHGAAVVDDDDAVKGEVCNNHTPQTRHHDAGS